jgi:Transcription factor WhiB
MAAAATPEPAGVSLIELAIGAGYRFADQRWRLRAACAGVDPEVFAITRGQSPEPAFEYCRRCEVRTECLQAALDLGPAGVRRVGLHERPRSSPRPTEGWDARRLLAELDGEGAPTAPPEPLAG